MYHPKNHKTKKTTWGRNTLALNVGIATRSVTTHRTSARATGA